MNANAIGRFDPETETFKEFPLRTRDAGPHGLPAAASGSPRTAAVASAASTRKPDESASTLPPASATPTPWSSAPTDACGSPPSTPTRSCASTSATST
jgi:hypothetical protein